MFKSKTEVHLISTGASRSPAQAWKSLLTVGDRVHILNERHFKMQPERLDLARSVANLITRNFCT